MRIVRVLVNYKLYFFFFFFSVVDSCNYMLKKKERANFASFT